MPKFPIYPWATIARNPPFFYLPSTGWGTYRNTGLGFIQGRFRDDNLLYGDVEYRYGISRNRLPGGVIFANAPTVTEQQSRRFEKTVPAAGAGRRICLNKVFNTNLAMCLQGLWFARLQPEPRLGILSKVRKLGEASC